MGKIRQNITASSVGSYLGKGFNSPEMQLEIDLLGKDMFFSEDTQKRLDLGNFMEDTCLNWFEKEYDTTIYHRNTEVVDAFNGMLRVKVDGKAMINGVEHVVEAKWSNSDAENFIDNEGYVMQLQCGMEAEGTEHGVLLGFYKGVPQAKFFTKDKEFIEDVYELAVSVGAILNGIATVDDYPWHLVEKYNPVLLQEGEEVVEFDEDLDKELVKEYLSLNEQIKELKEQADLIKGVLINKYPVTTFENDEFKVSVANRQRAGSLDKDKLRADYPDLDLAKYNKAPTVYKTLLARQK